MNSSITRVALIFLNLLLCLNSVAQYTNYKLKQDSVPPPEYPYTFPILGDKAVAAGFNLPLPAGIMLNYISMDQLVAIDALKVGFNDIDPVDLNFIEFSEIRGVTSGLTIRPDLWIFPFLNVYGLFGYGNTETHVSIVYPFKMNTIAHLEGYLYGFGVTTAMGVGNFWLAADLNNSWSDLDLLEDPVRVTVAGLRLGKTIVLNKEKQKNVAFWGGGMYQNIDVKTVGKIELNELFDSADQSVLDGMEEFYQGWLDDMRPGQALIVDKLIQGLRDKLAGNNTEGTTVSYDLEKRPMYNWNVIVGGQYQFNPRWQLRSELGLGWRQSFLITLNYRFGL